jgi:hypothetical protein
MLTKHRTFKSNLYELILNRHQQRKREALTALDSLIAACSSRQFDSLDEAIGDLVYDVEQRFEVVPEPTWVNAIGLTARATIDTPNSKYYGDYELTVISSDTSPYYKCVVTGPKGSVVWWKGCGTTETDAMESTGGWRHPMRRFFGLQARGKS